MYRLPAHTLLSNWGTVLAGSRYIAVEVGQCIGWQAIQCPTRRQSCIGCQPIDCGIVAAVYRLPALKLRTW